ncbi:PTS fructose transporter subunit IIC, partial [Limosilactobacillus reuteri]
GGSGKGGTKEATTTTESTNVASEGEITDDEL